MPTDPLLFHFKREGMLAPSESAPGWYCFCLYCYYYRNIFTWAKLVYIFKLKQSEIFKFNHAVCVKFVVLPSMQIISILTNKIHKEYIVQPLSQVNPNIAWLVSI